MSHFRSLALGLALGLAAAGPALAQKPGMGGDGASCTAQQRAVIAEAYDLAQVRVTAAIAFFDRDPSHAHVQRWFGDADRRTVRRNLGLIRASLAPGRRPPAICGDPRTCRAFAIIRDGRTIELCPRFFQAGREGQDSRFGVMVHEVSHVAAGTQDLAYQPFLSGKLAASDPEAAAANADNYEYFVEFLPGTPGGAGGAQPQPRRMAPGRWTSNVQAIAAEAAR